MRGFVLTEGLDRTDELLEDYLGAETRSKGENIKKFIRTFDKKRKDLEDEHGVPEGGFVHDRFHANRMLKKSGLDNRERRSIRRNAPNQILTSSHFRGELRQFHHDIHAEEKGTVCRN